LEAERTAAVAGRELAPETPNRVYLPQARSKFLEKKRLIDNDRETVTQFEKTHGRISRCCEEKVCRRIGGDDRHCHADQQCCLRTFKIKNHVRE
jgi:hypothetical protein